jgi:hypothetical protein
MSGADGRLSSAEGDRFRGELRPSLASAPLGRRPASPLPAFLTVNALTGPPNCWGGD